MGEAGGPRVGPSVRRRRRALDLTLADIAARTGLSVPFLSQIENDRARPSMRSLQLVADALDTTAVQLLAASENPRRVDVVRAEDDPGLASAREGVGGEASRVRPPYAAITSCTPWSSPVTTTAGANSGTGTTS